MPKCNTVLQSENDLFQHKIKPNSHGNYEFLALIRTIKSSKCFGHCPVINVYNVCYVFTFVPIYSLNINKPHYYFITSQTRIPLPLRSCYAVKDHDT